MKSNYRNIGDFIKLVDERNKGLKVTNLVGLSISKQFIKSVANTIGTDMENYKIIRKNQFACSTMQVRRDKKMPLALYNDSEPAIISQAYPIFEINDISKLLPEYLMMWFTRSEFDREACFHAVGGVRGSLEWEDFCGMQLPIPSIEKQQEIVREYHTIQNRIALNNQLISKLEEAAQAIYKQWFVDFEFPYVTSSGVEMPYKSNGGKMVWCAELGKEIPEGWEVKPFTTVVKLSGGGTPSTEEIKYWDGNIPFYTPGDLVQNYYSLSTSKHISELGLQKCSSKLYPINTTFVTARGATVGGVGLAGIPMAMNQTCYAITGYESCDFFAHQLTLETIQKLKKEATGATFAALVTKDFDGFLVIKPNNVIIKTFEKICRNLYRLMLNKSKENQKLVEFKDLLLAKMAKVETETYILN
jgi:type I restriction enzyme, S subunit